MAATYNRATILLTLCALGARPAAAGPFKCSNIAGALVVAAAVAGAGALTVNEFQKAADQEKRRELGHEFEQYYRGKVNQTEEEEYRRYWIAERMAGRKPLDLFEWLKPKWEGEYAAEIAKAGDLGADAEKYRRYWMADRPRNSRPFSVAQWRAQPVEFHRRAEYPHQEVWKEIDVLSSTDGYGIPERNAIGNLYQAYYLRVPLGTAPKSVANWHKQWAASLAPEFQRELDDYGGKQKFSTEEYRQYWYFARVTRTPLTVGQWLRQSPAERRRDEFERRSESFRPELERKVNEGMWESYLSAYGQYFATVPLDKTPMAPQEWKEKGRPLKHAD